MTSYISGIVHVVNTDFTQT